MVSPSTLSRMTPAEQKLFSDLSQEAAVNATNDIRKREGELVDEFKKKGVNVVVVDRNEFQQRVLKAITFESMKLDKKDWDRIIAIK